MWTYKDWIELNVLHLRSIMVSGVTTGGGGGGHGGARAPPIGWLFLNILFCLS